MPRTLKIVLVSVLVLLPASACSDLKFSEPGNPYRHELSKLPCKNPTDPLIPKQKRCRNNYEVPAGAR